MMFWQGNSGMEKIPMNRAKKALAKSPIPTESTVQNMTKKWVMVKSSHNINSLPLLVYTERDSQIRSASQHHTSQNTSVREYWAHAPFRSGGFYPQHILCCSSNTSGKYERSSSRPSGWRDRCATNCHQGAFTTKNTTHHPSIFAGRFL